MRADAEKLTDLLREAVKGGARVSTAAGALKREDLIHEELTCVFRQALRRIDNGMVIAQRVF